MTRSSLYQHLPHILLLTGAAIGLSLTPCTPTETHTPHTGVETRVQAEVVVEYDRSYMDAEGDTRSIGDIIRQARARMNAIKQAQDDEAEAADVLTPLASLMTEPQHRRMVKRKDVAALPKADHLRPTLVVEYAENANPLAWQTPEAIAAREYTVLAYGEVGGEEPEVTSSSLSSAVSSQPTSPTGVFTAAPDTNTPALTALPTAEILAYPQPSALADAPAIQTAPLRSASAPAPTPLASTAPTINEAGPDHLTVQTPAHASTPTEAHTSTINKNTQNVFAGEPQPTEQPRVSDSKQPIAGPDRGWEDKQVMNKHTPQNNPGVTLPRQASVDKHPDNQATSPAPTQDKRTNPLLVYIDEFSKIGTDRIKAIDNALSRINQAADKAGLGVELKTTTDKNTGYNIRFAEDDGKDMGNKLGLAEFAVTEDDHGNEFFLGENTSAQGGKAKVSINNAFNWFTGDDAEDIEKDEYDYQTAVEHEFLHLLGLDDDFDNLDSVSHGLLSPGEVRREIHDRELNTLTDLFANANPWRSAYNPASWSSNANHWGKTRYHAKALTAVVPEPASLGLIGLGLLVGAARRRTRF